MSLRKVGRFWWLDVWIDGRRVRRSLKTDNKFEALDRYKETKDQLVKAARKQDVTVEDFSKQYLNWAWSSKPASAIREQQRLAKIKRFFASECGITYLSEVTPYHLEQLRAWLKDRVMKVGDGQKILPRSRATINRYLQLLRGMFYKAIDWEVYHGANPVKKVRFFKEEHPIKPLSRSQVQRILEASQEVSKVGRSPLQKAFYDLVVLAANTGMRKAEILNLKWRDLRDDELEVRGKGDRVRTVPLNSAALAVITKQPRRSEWVFDVPNRRQPDLMRRTIAQIRKRSGIDWHFHLLRHFFTTLLIENGVDIITVSGILGHSKITTSLIYGHTDRSKTRAAVENLGMKPDT
jgi:integrase